MKSINIDITSATVLCRRHGTDMVSLHTKCPSTMPEVANQPLLLDFQVVRGGGKAYLMDKLGVPEEMINVIDPDYEKYEFGNNH